MKIGDKVRFLNAVGGGIVKRFKNNDIVWVEEEDGFETPTLIRECIVVEPDNTPVNLPNKSDAVKIETPPETLRRQKETYNVVELREKAKADSSYRQPAPVKKEKTPPVIEIDLHINQLLDSTAGMSNTDIISVQLGKFRQTMEENKSKKGQKIVFIHGKGEGVLRSAILSELKLKYKNFPVQDASFREYGFGATMVTIPFNSSNRS